MLRDAYFLVLMMLCLVWLAGCAAVADQAGPPPPPWTCHDEAADGCGGCYVRVCRPAAWRAKGKCYAVLVDGQRPDAVASLGPVTCGGWDG